MKRFFYPCLGLVALFAQSSAWAADLPKELPPGPLLRKGGDRCAWQITFSYNPQPPQATENPYLSAPPRKTTFTRTKAVWRAVTEGMNGKFLELCSDGKNEFIKSSALPAPTFVPTDDKGVRPPFLFDFGSGNYPDLDWISAETFVKIQPLQSRTALVFVNGDTTAWIDAETRFPIRWQRKGETRVFEQLPAPSQAVELPADVARLSADLKKASEALSRRADRMRRLNSGAK